MTRPHDDHYEYWFPPEYEDVACCFGCSRELELHEGDYCDDCLATAEANPTHFTGETP